MVLIGLAGGIGSGKTTVARFLREMGASHIDADKVGHEIYQKGTPGWRAVVNEFGPGILDNGENIDRRLLAAAVFGDPDRLATLNSIVHPLIKRRVQEIVEELGRQGSRVVVIEGAVLIEAGWKDFVDEVWTVSATEGDVVQRVKTERKASEEEVRSRIRAQITDEERKRHSVVVIENTGSQAELSEKVRREWECLLERRKLRS